MKVILAVSGGVDSVAMLHSLISGDGFADGDFTDIIVAHFDHGIRTDSSADAQFVGALASSYDLDFELGRANLGANVNEANARKARWDFLNSLQDKYQAPIATAHHADDVFETQIINLLRGSGRRGLSVLKGSSELKRPLINRSKEEIYDYACLHKLEFVEDSTNHDMKHLRNRVRNIYIPKLGDNQKLNQLISKVVDINAQLEPELSTIYEQIVFRKDEKLVFDRMKIRKLDRKVLAEIFRKCFDDLNVIHQKQKIQRHTIELLTDFAKRKDSNKMHDISKNIKAKLTKTHLELIVIDK
jgi:tRNA(Ile)-lysidine synthase